ncbi:hypothetical protein HYV64_00375 [Candidatus Shapirobacteria bacterium]|nr:hypothetical protein [Candidatus Shapirobacteria bacterium]
MPDFTAENYPKSFGTVDSHNFRLKSYLDLSNRQLYFVDKKFWDFINLTAHQIIPITVYKNYQYLAHGWEWSVFRDGNSVIKIPSGKFIEVNDPKYLDNTKTAYGLICQYFPSKFIAQTTFERNQGLNIITQEYISGKSNFKIGYHSQNKLLLRNLQKLLESMLALLRAHNWLPDFDIHRDHGGFVLRNIIFTKYHCPKIVDFTAYYDVYRLYPYRQQKEILSKRRQIKDFLSWIKQKNG